MNVDGDEKCGSTHKITLTPVLSKNYVPAIDDLFIKTNKKTNKSILSWSRFYSGQSDPHYP